MKESYIICTFYLKLKRKKFVYKQEPLQKLKKYDYFCLKKRNEIIITFYPFSVKNTNNYIFTDVLILFTLKYINTLKNPVKSSEPINSLTWPLKIYIKCLILIIHSLY